MSYDPEKLRKKAKELLGQKTVEENPDILNNIEKLIEEYNIHKIELELQQDELFRSNQELEMQNRKLDDLFENAPVGYFILDENGIILNINTTAAKYLHVTKELLIGKNFNQFIHPGSQDHFYFHWQKITQTKNTDHVEILLNTGNENPEYFLLNSQPYRDNQSSQWSIRVSATNVSEIKEAELLRDSERRYRLLFKNMINGLMVLKPTYRKGQIDGFAFFRANSAFEKMIGINARKMEGAPLNHIFPDNASKLLPTLFETVSTRSNQNLEHFLLKEGLYVNLYSFLPEDGFVAIIAEDVTGQVEAEQQRAKSEELLQTVFKILPVGVTITNDHGAIIDCNPASEGLLGLKKEEHLIRNFAGAEWEIIRTDLSPMPAEEFASVRALKEKRIVDNVEMGIVKDQNNITWINVSAAPIPLTDMGVAIVYSDITERVQAQEETEEKFRNIIQNSTDAIIIVNQAGAIIEWNKGCELIFGHRRQAVLGQKIWDFMEQVVASSSSLLGKSIFGNVSIVEALRTGESGWFKKINETEIKDKCGKFKTIQSVAFPVKSANGFLLGIVARDISESKETEKMLKIAKEQAEEASLMKSQFLANISHEIRTPLNAIMGFTEILKENRMGDKKIRSHLSGIEKSGKALMGLINDILDLSRIEAGKMELNPESFNLAELVEDVRQIFSLKAEQKGLYINVILGTDIPEYILLDELRLRQILFNLVGNAVKFTEAGGITISAITNKKPTLNHLVDLTLKVTDTGLGILDQDKEAIFDPFFQKHPRGNIKQEGTGLGLSISKRFAEMMGGKLTVESSPGKATVFILSIPSIPVTENLSNKKKKSIGTPQSKVPLSASHKELCELIFEELTQKLGSQAETVQFMQNMIWSEYDKIADILGFEEVLKFSAILTEIAAKEKLIYLADFALNLSKEAKAFNVIEINQMLTSFESLRN